jgi:putative mycofactocin binding protein MftB
MDLDRVYALSPQVVIRPERFGGLMYRYDTRKLYFLYSHVLVDFLTELDGTRSIGEALDAFVAARGLTPQDREALVTALVQLERMDVVHEV